MLAVLAQAVEQRHGRFRQLEAGRVADPQRRLRRRRARPADADEIVQRAVAHLPLLGHIHAGAVQRGHVRAQHHRGPGRRLLAEDAAQAGVQPGGAGLLVQPFAPGRVGGQQPLVGEITAAQGAQLAPLEVHQPAHPGALGVVQRVLNGVRVGVEALQRRQPLEPALQAGGGLAQGLFPERLAAAAPGLEAVLAAQRAGRHAGGHPGRLDHQGAAAAERIQQRRRPLLAVPAAGAQQRRRQILAQRRPAAGQPVTAPVQRRAGQVQPQAGAVFVQPGTHRAGALLAPGLADLRRQGTQQPLTADPAVATHALAVVQAQMQVHAGRHQGPPVHRRRQTLRRLVRGHVQFRQQHQHPLRQARPQAGPQGVLLQTLNPHMGVTRICYRDAQLSQLVGEQGAQAGQTGNYEIHGFCPASACFKDGNEKFIGWTIIRHTLKRRHHYGDMLFDTLFPLSHTQSVVLRKGDRGAAAY